ncbi:hypothetical protein [Erythrobacter sp. JK5]|uniref:hypothetical protein n=1 Tax=Erythrobacter sp. JK5 TaxID=2829500 RepID=UPI001BA580CE|nr:hypothetical protein [Erythrobacter sp. JK5]QUL37987.1 hypothetical protein KDC96_00690 [Erythrobacter sp. JK5]
MPRMILAPDRNRRLLSVVFPEPCTYPPHRWSRAEEMQPLDRGAGFRMQSRSQDQAPSRRRAFPNTPNNVCLPDTTKPLHETEKFAIGKKW